MFLLKECLKSPSPNQIRMVNFKAVKWPAYGYTVTRWFFLPNDRRSWFFCQDYSALNCINSENLQIIDLTKFSLGGDYAFHYEREKSIFLMVSLGTLTSLKLESPR